MSLNEIKELLPTGSFSHACIVVGDIEKIYENYSKIPGAELTPLKQTNEPEIAKVIYRGVSTPTIARQFFVTMGGLRTEVLQPDEHPNVWAEILERQGGSSLHHLGFNVECAEPIIKFFADKGMGILQVGNFVGGRYIYLDTLDEFGMIIEVIEMS